MRCVFAEGECYQFIVIGMVKYKSQIIMKQRLNKDKKGGWKKREGTKKTNQAEGGVEDRKENWNSGKSGTERDAILLGRGEHSGCQTE